MNPQAPGLSMKLSRMAQKIIVGPESGVRLPRWKTMIGSLEKRWTDRISSSPCTLRTSALRNTLPGKCSIGRAHDQGRAGLGVGWGGGGAGL